MCPQQLPNRQLLPWILINQDSGCHKMRLGRFLWRTHSLISSSFRPPDEQKCKEIFIYLWISLHFCNREMPSSCAMKPFHGWWADIKYNFWTFSSFERRLKSPFFYIFLQNSSAASSAFRNLYSNSIFILILPKLLHELF